ncbi:fatty acyl-CoA reductase wat-like [Metopolophium dirhodum]|uniref:fatty acyl-CoA reductase wat-like n=1 Tax=Metopolophium dirhodum TaxID=44670 RepID=UPI0029902EFB|nr:fatty acyl-CoA reductase wat-like [Metopolophium dirhodum]
MEACIPETFRNGIVLVTGSTGFLGKILIEKILRSCPVKKIAILVRSKKGFNVNQRVADMYKQAVFDRIRSEKPGFTDLIKIIDSNLEDSSMGLTTADRDWIVENVNFVFHCAATIRFNETLESASKINIQGTEKLLSLATQMKNLKGFVHVSTAYSHCPRDEIKEQYYPVPITAKDLKNMFGLNDSTPRILEDWPNTYCFTKAIAENLVLINGIHLPISVFRPSIIGCTKSEPGPGWLENMNGPSGIVAGVMTGFLRTVPIVRNKITDIVPADYTVNALISVMWDTVNRYQNSNLINQEPKVYNYVSSVESPLLWGRYIEEINGHYHEAPPLQSIWYIFYVFYTNLWIGKMLRFVLHRIPAELMDFWLTVCGKSPKILKMYVKTECMMDLLYEFTTRQWKFDNSNTRELWSLLSQDDRNAFWYSLEEFDWTSYIKIYFYGIRKHVLHEELSNVAKATEKNRKLFWMHQLCISLIIYVAFQACWTFVSYIHID